MDIQQKTEAYVNDCFQTLTPPRGTQEHSALPNTTGIGRGVRQKSEGKIEIPSHSHKKPKADKPLEGRHSKKTEDKTQHPKHSTGAKDKAKKEDTGKHSSKPGFFSESHFGIRDNLSKGFHQIFQLLGLEAAPIQEGNEAAAIQETIQSSGHTSPLLVVNNALFYLVNTIDNHFFGDKIPDAAVNTVRDIVGKIVEHINLNTLPDIFKKTTSGRVQSSQAPASLQDIINATKQDNAIAESLPKALEAITGVTGLKPKSLGVGDKIQLSFNHAKLNLVKAIELIKEILRSDLHLGTLLLDLIPHFPHFAQSSLVEHTTEKAERLDWN